MASKDLSAYTVVKLKEMLDLAEIDYDKKARKADLIALLHASLQSRKKDTPKDSQKSMPKKKELVQVGSQPEILGFLHSKRLIVVVKFDDEYDHLSDECSGHPDLCENYTFEYSTGTSNDFNFKNVFLPILRMDSTGWLHKDGDEKVSTIVRKHFYAMVIVKELSEECRLDMNNFLIQFISRFGCWKHIQISAALAKPNDLWYNTRFFKILKNLAFEYNYCKTMPISYEIDVIKTYKEIERRAGRPDPESIEKPGSMMSPAYKSFIYVRNARERINEIEKLGMQDVLETLWLRRLEHSSYENGFFYKRHTPIVPIKYDLPEFVMDRSLNLNEEMRKYNALCRHVDDKSQLGGRNQTDVKIVSAYTTPDDPAKYYGWRKCE